MSQAIVGGIIGALASAFTVKRVVSVDGVYVGAGTIIENVLFGICVDTTECLIDYTDYDGNTYTDTTLTNSDIVIAKKPNIKSGNMFALTFKTTGLV